MSGWAALADCIQSLQPKHHPAEFLPIDAVAAAAPPTVEVDTAH